MPERAMQQPCVFADAQTGVRQNFDLSRQGIVGTQTPQTVVRQVPCVVGADQQLFGV